MCLKTTEEMVRLGPSLEMGPRGPICVGAEEENNEN
jgi:hypothetical protein